MHWRLVFVTLIAAAACATAALPTAATPPAIRTTVSYCLTETTTESNGTWVAYKHGPDGPVCTPWGAWTSGSGR